MKLGWYINRFRSMKPAEVLHRLIEHRRKAASRNRDEGWQLYPAEPLHPVLPEIRASILAATLPQRQAIATAASMTLAGQFSALGVDWPARDPGDLFPVDLWRLDPVKGAAWPGTETYTFDIGYRHDGSRGDIKYVWEINRLQMLPVLAAHFLLDGDAASLAAVEAAIDSWHAANPPFRGVAWASGIEVALRSISLLVTLDLLGAQLSQATRTKVGEILHAGVHWLPRFPSRFSSANNHLVAELVAEFLLGLAFGKPARQAREMLVAEVQRQIHPDGTGAEQSPTYAAFTAEMVLIAALAARQAGSPLPGIVEDRLTAYAAFVGWLGPRAGFGDDDEGRVLSLGDEENYSGSIAAAIAGFYQKTGLQPDEGDLRSVLFGAPPAIAPPVQGLHTLPQGGLSIWHGDIADRQIELGFDHGPLGYLAIAAHGHADALSVNLSIDGQPVLVDPGTFLYGSGGVWRSWFRSTPAHNTLNIAGESQSVMSGAFNWSHKAATTLDEAVPGPDWRLAARHDGYRRRFGVLHQRRLELASDAIVITDQLLGGSQNAEIVFQLAIGLTAVLDGSTVLVSRGGEALLAIQFPDANIDIARGGDAPGQGGWVSPRFGTRQPAERLAWRGTVGEAGVTMRLVPIRVRSTPNLR